MTLRNKDIISEREFDASLRRTLQNWVGKMRPPANARRRIMEQLQRDNPNALGMQSFGIRYLTAWVRIFLRNPEFYGVSRIQMVMYGDSRRWSYSISLALSQAEAKYI